MTGALALKVIALGCKWLVFPPCTSPPHSLWLKALTVVKGGPSTDSLCKEFQVEAGSGVFKRKTNLPGEPQVLLRGYQGWMGKGRGTKPPLHTPPLTPAVGMGPIFPPQQQVPEDTAQFPHDSSSPPTPVCIMGTPPASWAWLPSQASPQAPTSHHGHNSPSASQQNSWNSSAGWG